MKNILSILLLLGLSTFAKAQHCSWCGCSVIILDVRDSLTNDLIYDLDIILADSTGKPYTSEWNLRNYTTTSIFQNTDTLKFGQNNKIADSEVDNIPFGIDRYMLFVYANNCPNLYRSETDKIIIKDPKSRYNSLSIILDQNKVGSMCMNSAIRRDENVLNTITIKVKLNKNRRKALAIQTLCLKLNKQQTMKLFAHIFFLLPCLTFAQTDNQKLVDSLKYTTDVPFLDPNHSLMKFGCGDSLFWKIVKQKKEIVPLLLNKLTDTTKTNITVPIIGRKYTVADISYAAIREIIVGLPTFDQLLSLKVDCDGGRSHYWELTKDFMHRESLQIELEKWYNKNEIDFIWVSSNKFLTCDCDGKHPSGGHYELKK